VALNTITLKSPQYISKTYTIEYEVLHDTTSELVVGAFAVVVLKCNVNLFTIPN